MTRVAIIGASGFIGYRLYRYLREAGEDVVGTFCARRIDESLVPLDFTDAEALEAFLCGYRPEVLYWIAANKNVAYCEEHPEDANRVNAESVASLVEIARRGAWRGRLIYMSSDYVFRGDKGGYKDTDELEPKTVYGRTKEEAESIIRSSDLDFAVIRTSAVMGRGGVFFDWLTKELTLAKDISMFTNVYFTPTPMPYLLENLHRICERFEEWKGRTIHIVGETRMSRFDFGNVVRELMGEQLARSRIVPDELDLSKALFSSDLSMISTDGVVARRGWRAYLLDEILLSIEKLRDERK